MMVRIVNNGTKVIMRQLDEKREMHETAIVAPVGKVFHPELVTKLLEVAKSPANIPVRRWMRWSGTKALSTTMVSLPVPFIPVTYHESSMVKSEAGMWARATGFSVVAPNSTSMPREAQVAAKEPDEYGQRPLIT